VTDDGYGPAGRAKLEDMRRRGRRLVAQDEERLFEYEMADLYYCDSCCLHFASARDPPDVQLEKRMKHSADFHGG
jgi:hypothetical protein